MKYKISLLARVISSVVSAAMILSSSNFISVIAADSEIAVGSDVYINEICAQNKSCLSDSYGLYSDWIEIYNAADTVVDLYGCGLSDNASNTLLWTFPKDTVIGAGEYLIVFASGRESTSNELHTPFSLSKNGETLMLSTPDGSTVQKVTFPTLGEDKTYGRIKNGDMEVMTPTPGKANEEVVTAPTFSVGSGFFDKEFSMKLSSAAGTEIYYTIDGSDPLTSETSMLYTGDITIKDRSDEPNIYSAYTEDGTATSISAGTYYKAPTYLVDKACIVRAAAKNSDGTFSPVVQQSYFVTDGELANYKDMTVVSLVTDPDNLFDPDKGIYVVGKKWDWSNDDVWAEDSDPATMRNYHGRGKAWEREASITVFENGNAVVEQNMGIRIKGSSTRNSAQKSFNLFARSDYGASKLSYPIFPDNTDWEGNIIDEYDSLSLRAVSAQRFRDVIGQDLISDREVATMEMKPCVLFINGEYWGFYEITERLSAEYIESNYGIPEKNVAMVKDGQSEEGAEIECSNFISTANSLSKLNMTVLSNYQKACDFIDVDSLIEHYAAGIYYGVWDWPNYNYGAWRNTGGIINGNPYSDGKWRMMSFDFDHSMGYTYDSSMQNTKLYTYNSFTHISNKNYAPTNLFIAMLKNEEFRSKFIKVYRLYADDIASAEKVTKLMEQYSKQYSDMIVNSEYRWDESWFSSWPSATKEQKLASIRSFLNNDVIANVTEFFQNRANYTLNHMYSYLGVDPSDYEFTYTISDLITLQKWLTGSGKLSDWEKYDLCEDKRINIFDMAVLRRKVMASINRNPNMITNTNGWSFAVDTNGGSDAEFTAFSGGFSVDVKSVGTVAWGIQAKYKGLTMESGASYQLSFDYESTKNIISGPNVMQSSGDYLSYYYNEIEFTPETRHFIETFTMNSATDTNTRLSFDFGSNSDIPFTAKITNIRLIRIS